MTVQLNLTVNDVPINTDYFVARFVNHTVSGMVESLEGTGRVKELDLTIEDDRLSILFNGKSIPVNEFVTKIFKSTLQGVLSPLKGVTTPIRKVDIRIRK
jgi:hypothetical protein